MAGTPMNSHCGGLLDENFGQWPRTCHPPEHGGCGRINYNSPKPVIVLRSWGRPEQHLDHPGVIVIKRGIEPHKGDWAFPGGYIDHAEDWRHAAARECYEELGFRPDQRHLQLLDVTSTDTNFLVLFVGSSEYSLTSNDGWAAHDLKSTLNDTGEQEVLAIEVWNHQATPLGVPSHNRFFQNMRLTP